MKTTQIIMHLRDLQNKNKSKTKTVVRNCNKIGIYKLSRNKKMYQKSLKGIVDSLKVEI